jgi:hypothetical protein
MFTNKAIAQLIGIIKGETNDLVDLTKHQQIIFDEAKRHRVAGLVYRSLSTYPSVPTNLLDQFKSGYRYNMCHALNQLSCLSKIKKLALANHIRLLCVKGIVLSHQLYQDIAARTSADIDIAISPSDLIKLDAVLKQLGFKAPHSIEKLPKLLSITNEIHYFHPEKNLAVDVHYQLTHTQTAFFSFEELWAQRQVIKLPNGECFNTLSNEHAWLYLCLHGSSHCYKRLQWLCDIVHFQKLYVPAPASRSLADAVNRFKAHRYYRLACLLIDMFHHKEVREKAWYFRFALKFMQHDTKKPSVLYSVLARIHYFLLANNSAERVVLLYQQAKNVCKGRMLSAGSRAISD